MKKSKIREDCESWEYLLKKDLGIGSCINSYINFYNRVGVWDKKINLLSELIFLDYFIGCGYRFLEREYKFKETKIDWVIGNGVERIGLEVYCPILKSYDCGLFLEKVKKKIRDKSKTDISFLLCINLDYIGVKNMDTVVECITDGGLCLKLGDEFRRL
jgi:hypothetical protein